ncbi:hypothetical protein R3P38DRAFT_3198233 [Favolaschia claudopus]|uniref:Uncharacterized protein n=1 Tax=Favolaschia claudopus TaxID=2862362 RepID=A0AAW0B3B4_9AGAR
MITLRYTWLFHARDTPLRALYRLYDKHIGISRTCQTLKTLTELEIIASLVEDLVDSFNYKIKLGLRREITFEKPWLIKNFKNEADPPLESAPIWTSRVGPLAEHLELSPKCKAIPAFARRNIKANTNQLRNI